MLDRKVLKTITALYVEDSPSIAKYYMELFSKIFKKTYLAIDGEDGLYLFEKYEYKIDIIITDINMPNMNGLDMLKEINKLSKYTIPTIVITAYENADYLLDAINLQVGKYLRKPLVIQDLMSVTTKLVLKTRKQKKLLNLTKGLVEKSTKDEEINKKLHYVAHRAHKEKVQSAILIDMYIISLEISNNGVITDVSSKFCDVFNYFKDGIIGNNINILTSKATNKESFQKLMLNVIRTKKTLSSTLNLNTNDNRLLKFDIDMTPKYDSNSMVSGYTIYLDVVLS